LSPFWKFATPERSAPDRLLRKPDSFLPRTAPLPTFAIEALMSLETRASFRMSTTSWVVFGSLVTLETRPPRAEDFFSSFFASWASASRGTPRATAVATATAAWRRKARRSLSVAASGRGDRAFCSMRILLACPENTGEAPPGGRPSTSNSSRSPRPSIIPRSSRRAPGTGSAGGKGSAGRASEEAPPR
jgi:hypothetical protein